jgi:hypothetical protein
VASRCLSTCSCYSSQILESLCALKKQISSVTCLRLRSTPAYPKTLHDFNRCLRQSAVLPINRLVCSLLYKHYFYLTLWVFLHALPTVLSQNPKRCHNKAMFLPPSADIYRRSETVSNCAYVSKACKDVLIQFIVALVQNSHAKDRCVVMKCGWEITMKFCTNSNIAKEGMLRHWKIKKHKPASKSDGFRLLRYVY